MSFRVMMRRRWAISVADLSGHILLAVFLPGKWWYQFIPDVCLIAMVPISLRTDELLPGDVLLIRVHRVLHTLIPVLVLIAAMIFTEDLLWGVIGTQWLTHVLWDQFTHPEREFKKGLLWP